MRPPGAGSWWIIRRICTAFRTHGGNRMKSSSIAVAALLAAGCTVLGCSSSPSAQGDAGWATLFDGSSLDNWNQIGNANWRLAEGVVQAHKGSRDLLSNNSYRVFQLRVEVRFDSDANTGSC